MESKVYLQLTPVQISEAEIDHNYYKDLAKKEELDVAIVNVGVSSNDDEGVSFVDNNNINKSDKFNTAKKVSKCDVYNPTKYDLRKYTSLPSNSNGDDGDTVFDPSKDMKESQLKLIKPNNKRKNSKIKTTTFLELDPRKQKRAARERKYRNQTRVQHNQLIYRIVYLQNEMICFVQELKELFEQTLA